MKRIKPHGKVHIFKTQPKIYMPKLVRQELDAGNTDCLHYVVDANTVLFFNPKTPVEKIVEGLEALRAHLLARVVEVEEESSLGGQGESPS